MGAGNAEGVFRQCMARLAHGPALDVSPFLAWFSLQGGGDWLRLKNRDDETILYTAMKSKVPKAVIDAVAATLPVFAVCVAHLEQGPELDVAAFTSWWEEHKTRAGGVWTRETDSDNETVLHLAIQYNVPEAVTCAIASTCPGAAQAKNTAGIRPLVLALQQLELSNVTATVLRTILGAWPEAGSVLGHDGSTVVSLALENNATPAAFLSALMKVTPPFLVCEAHFKRGSSMDAGTFLPWFEAHKGGGWINQTDADGYTTLHNAVAYSGIPEAAALAVVHAWTEAAAAAGANSAASSPKNKWGSTPLHLAFKTDRVSAGVTLALLNASPGAASEKDADGLLPLHHALKNHHSVPAACHSALMKVTPPFLVCEEHFACFKQGFYASVDTFVPWLKAHKGGGWIRQQKDADGCTTLHNAVATSGIPEAIALAVIHAWTEAAAVAGPASSPKNNRGSTPLHLALKSGVSERVTLALVNASPGAASEKDADGLLPLHCALKNKAPEAVTCAVFDAWPLPRVWFS